MKIIILTIFLALICSCQSHENFDCKVNMEISQTTPRNMFFKISNNSNKEICLIVPISNEVYNGEYFDNASKEWTPFNGGLGFHAIYPGYEKKLKQNEVFHLCIFDETFERLANKKIRWSTSYSWGEGNLRKVVTSNPIIFMSPDAPIDVNQRYID